MKEAWDISMADKQDGIAIALHQQIGCFMWLSVADTQQQMKMWRKRAKAGELKICAYNNKEVVVDGKTWYILIVQPYKDGKLCGEIDASGLMIFGIMATGFIYAFKTEANRDMTYKYVMKGVEEPSR